LLFLSVFLVNDGKKSYIIEAGTAALFKYSLYCEKNYIDWVRTVRWLIWPLPMPQLIRIIKVFTLLSL